MLKQLRKAEDALDRVNPRAHVDLNDLYDAGGALTTLTGYLADAVRLGIRGSVKDLRDKPVYDDTQVDEYLRAIDGGQAVDPQVRLDEAIQHLDEFHRHLAQARDAVSRYHSAIGHIGIRLNPRDGDA